MSLVLRDWRLSSIWSWILEQVWFGFRLSSNFFPLGDTADCSGSYVSDSIHIYIYYFSCDL